MTDPTTDIFEEQLRAAEQEFARVQSMNDRLWIYAEGRSSHGLSSRKRASSGSTRDRPRNESSLGTYRQIGVSARPAHRRKAPITARIFVGVCYFCPTRQITNACTKTLGVCPSGTVT
jgi:hypothetical protein